MAMPQRFGLQYVGRDGQLHQPAMLHRAILGSLERFMAIYLEHTLGDFPFWVAPIQVAVLPISERQLAHAEDVTQKLRNAIVRVQLDDRSETLGFKIREAETQKVPLMLVIGEKEAEAGSVTPRLRGDKKKGSGSCGVDAVVAQLVEDIAGRRPRPLSEM